LHLRGRDCLALMMVVEAVEQSCLVPLRGLHSSLGYVTPAAYEACLASARRAGRA
jgi:hypothetical protein